TRQPRHGEGVSWRTRLLWYTGQVLRSNFEKGFGRRRSGALQMRAGGTRFVVSQTSGAARRVPRARGVRPSKYDVLGDRILVGMKWLFALLLAFAIFGGAAYFSYNVLFKQEIALQKEQRGEI